MSADDSYSQALDAAARHARRYVTGLSERPVRERAGVEELTSALDGELPEEGEDAAAVVEELARAAEPGVVATGGPRYFGFVIGGTLPAALAADWLAATWDQPAGLYVCGPSAAVAEEVAGRWLLELLGLPESAAFGLTTGGTMANFTGLAAARHAVLGRAGWEVEARGLQGAPGVRVLVGEHAHSTILLSLRMLGLGEETAVRVGTDDQGRMLPAELRGELEGADGPAIVCAQAGEVNTGCFDPLEEIADACQEHGAWLHLDGAIGLWAAASPELSHLTRGLERADSWCTDAHKWLNVPYDCGFVAVADPEALRAAVGVSGAYLVASPVRDASQYVPELSRRARGLSLYAALRSLGRRGVRELVERCTALAQLIAGELEADPRLELLNEVVINQVLFALTDPVDESGERTAAMVERIQLDGTCWLAGTTWRGRPAIRVSVCNWQTSEGDARRSAAAIRAALDPITA
jgi:glutamate/tyrosine decarboxylase-like PLP-dependent enzyme